ncbi:TetR/AcrR family transcriptional regulator [Streptomyces caeni]|uniref:TetR/AcrR family transcriptional regulator n=1 Tax=Streptomyces caeni TaxID=2307231 RepID=A0ABW4IJL9_9ACTN
MVAAARAGCLTRPRSTDTDQAILDAAREVLLREGYAGLSMEKVAAKAGVGKPTAYRRWRSKAALVGDVARRGHLSVVPDGELPAPGPGSVAQAMTTWFRSHADVYTDPRVSALALALTAAAAENPLDAESLCLHHTRHQHAAIADLLRAGVEHGEFRSDADIDAVVDALVGSTLYLLLTGRTTVAAERAEGLARVLLNGLRDPGPRTARPRHGHRGRPGPFPEADGPTNRVRAGSRTRRRPRTPEAVRAESLG